MQSAVLDVSLFGRNTTGRWGEHPSKEQLCCRNSYRRAGKHFCCFFKAAGKLADCARVQTASLPSVSRDKLRLSTGRGSRSLTPPNPRRAARVAARQRRPPKRTGGGGHTRRARLLPGAPAPTRPPAAGRTGRRRAPPHPHAGAGLEGGGQAGELRTEAASAPPSAPGTTAPGAPRPPLPLPAGRPPARRVLPLLRPPLPWQRRARLPAPLPPRRRRRR